MVYCAVFGCKNESSSKKKAGVRFFRFPKDEKVAARWVQACRRSDAINLRTAVICSRHFTPADEFKSLRHQLMNISPVNRRRIHPDAIPTVHLPFGLPTTAKPSAKVAERSERATKRARRQLVQEMLVSTPSVLKTAVVENEHVEENCEPSYLFTSDCTIQNTKKLLHTDKNYSFE